MNKIMPIVDKLVVAKKIPNGYSWTLTSLLGAMLTDIETRYGSRDRNYTILGVEFADIVQPQIWFPGNSNNVAVQLTLHCMTNPQLAVFQLAHESIHLLSPELKGQTNILEEGLATYYSVIAQTQEMPYYNLFFSPDQSATPIMQRLPTTQNYIDAWNAVLNLLDLAPDIIKNLRHECPRLSQVSQSLLQKHGPQIPAELAGRLLASFQN